jgi:hypothetical protein
MSAFLSFRDLYTLKASRGRYPDCRSILILKIRDGSFPPPIRQSRAPNSPMLWDEPSLTIYDRCLAASGDPKLAVKAALQARAALARAALKGLPIAAELEVA